MTRLGPGDERWEMAAAMAEALNARDMERIIELSDPDLEFGSIVAAAEGEVFRGLAGLREWQARVESVIDGFRIELLEVHDAGPDRIVVLYRMRGTGRASGVPIDQRVGQVWTWEDGVPGRNEVFSDPADALRAAGLDPERG